MKSITALLIIAAACGACAASRDSGTAMQAEAHDGSNDTQIAIIFDSKVPKAIIYKTKADYNDLVPVTMNESRTAIVSYPAPSDLVSGGIYMKPTELAEGYLLDNRGITPNTAFLDYTYEEYAALDPFPTAEELLQHVKVKYPLAEMYYVGRTSSPDKLHYYNSIIESGFAGCNRVEFDDASD